MGKRKNFFAVLQILYFTHSCSVKKKIVFIFQAALLFYIPITFFSTQFFYRLVLGFTLLPFLLFFFKRGKLEIGTEVLSEENNLKALNFKLRIRLTAMVSII